jgi:DNA-binding NarL/FixJ family response regulator
VIPRAMVLELVLELRGSGASGGLLTGREAQVLRLLRRGFSTAAIAERLEIAPVTVRRHISELVHKLGVEDRSGLAESGGRWFSTSGNGNEGLARSL